MKADKDCRVEEGNTNSKKDKQCSRESMRERMRETEQEYKNLINCRDVINRRTQHRRGGEREAFQAKKYIRGDVHLLADLSASLIPLSGMHNSSKSICRRLWSYPLAWEVLSSIR